MADATGLPSCGRYVYRWRHVDGCPNLIDGDAGDWSFSEQQCALQPGPAAVRNSYGHLQEWYVVCPLCSCTRERVSRSTDDEVLQTLALSLALQWGAARDSCVEILERVRPPRVSTRCIAVSEIEDLPLPAVVSPPHTNFVHVPPLPVGFRHPRRVARARVAPRRAIKPYIRVTEEIESLWNRPRVSRRVFTAASTCSKVAGPGRRFTLSWVPFVIDHWQAEIISASYVPDSYGSPEFLHAVERYNQVVDPDVPWAFGPAPMIEVPRPDFLTVGGDGDFGIRLLRLWLI